MSVSSNPDRVYVSREYRAKIRLNQDDAEHPRPSVHDVGLPGMGATLLDISAGGCCLRLAHCDTPLQLGPEHTLSSIKLLHPDLEASPIGGRIAWSRTAPPHVLLGIQFTHIQPSTLASIQRYLETHRPSSV